MEPFTAAAIAIAVTVATKALEKAGEQVGEAAFNKVTNTVTRFLTSLKKRSPETTTAIERAPETSPDYEKAVLAVRAAAQSDFDIAEAVQELLIISEENPPRNLAKYLEEIKAATAQSRSAPETFVQNIQKAVNVAEQQNIDQRGATFNL